MRRAVSTAAGQASPVSKSTTFDTRVSMTTPAKPEPGGTLRCFSFAAPSTSGSGADQAVIRPASRTPSPLASFPTSPHQPLGAQPEYTWNLVHSLRRHRRARHEVLRPIVFRRPRGEAGQNIFLERRPPLASRGTVSRDAGEVGGERALQASEVAQRLHAQPELEAVAAELAQPERHLGVTACSPSSGGCKGHVVAPSLWGRALSAFKRQKVPDGDAEGTGERGERPGRAGLPAGLDLREVARRDAGALGQGA
jgi:hypothetical protein